MGTLKPWHGVEDLVRAFAILHAADPSYRLLLVGDGPERGRIEQLIADLTLDGAVELTGAVEPVDIPGSSPDGPRGGAVPAWTTSTSRR